MASLYRCFFYFVFRIDNRIFAGNKQCSRSHNTEIFVFTLIAKINTQGIDKQGSSRERKYKNQVEFLNQVIVNIEARLKVFKSIEK